MQAWIELIVRVTTVVVDLDRVIEAAQPIASSDRPERERAEMVLAMARAQRARLLDELDMMKPRRALVG
jgi:hypothetical protein